MIRVAYLCEFPSVNGGENSLLSFLASTPEEIDPIVLCPQAGPFAERLRQLGIASEVLHIVDSNGQRKDKQTHIKKENETKERKKESKKQQLNF